MADSFSRTPHAGMAVPRRDCTLCNGTGFVGVIEGGTHGPAKPPLIRMKCNCDGTITVPPRSSDGSMSFTVSETSTPCKYTDAIVDAPRQLLAYAETPGRTLEGARIYLHKCGVKFEHCWPDWAYENGHLTKGGLAELVHRMMEGAR